MSRAGRDDRSRRSADGWAIGVLRLAIGRTWCPAAVWHAGKATDAESIDREYLACVRLAGQRVVVEVGPGGGDEQCVPAGAAERA